jgi:hydroxymethylpyrimidine/phosphomethylpyrimidine kinase
MSVLPVVLCFGITDPVASTGIVADAMTLISLGAYPACVVTAVSAQDTNVCEGIHLMDPDFINEQARLLLEDMPVLTFKIGFIGSVDHLMVICDILSDYPDLPVVLELDLNLGEDADVFVNEELIDAYKKILLPYVTLLIVNEFDLSRMFDSATDDIVSMDQLVQYCIQLGCNHVLLLDTVLGTGQIRARLDDKTGNIRMDVWPQHEGSFRGLNTTLATSIAAILASDASLPEAVRDAQEYTWESMRAGLRMGMGSKVPDRLFWMRDSE